MDGYMLRFQIIWKSRATRFLMMVSVVFVVVGFQNLVLSTDSSSLLSFFGLPVTGKERFPASVEKESSLPNNTRNITARIPDLRSEDGGDNGTEESFDDSDDADADFDDGHAGDEFVFEIGNGTVLKKEKNGHIVVVKASGGGGERGGLLKQLVNDSSSSSSSSSFKLDDANNSNLAPSDTHTSSPANKIETQKLPGTQRPEKKKKRQPFLGVWSMSDMDRELAENRASSRSMIPRWRSKVDRQMVYAREQIERAPLVNANEELYAPVFRNLSKFKRSYELMEKMLKVYVYKEGARPIFHKPFLTGIYASEGWFMKQMEENGRFLVKDPTKAHLFYMPFSSRILQQVLYIADSHSHRNLIDHLRKYVGTISSKYPFWNRTGGADHFLAGCHDWATHETGQSMDTAIRALCNADVWEGFEIGKDVSLPETNVVDRRNPLRNLGGKPSHMRTTLAFFAGKMHGYLRPRLLQHWENKHPDMVISGPIPHRIRESKKKKKKRKTSTRYPYVDYMKDSKYCICPRGYEVNSPRVVEAIFYGCVPVIISDNFVPPFFEVLNWPAFSVVLPEKDLPRLREVLLGINQSRYAELERGVSGVRRHLLWNRRPAKYDLFHMILHNVWFNRLHQIHIE